MLVIYDDDDDGVWLWICCFGMLWFVGFSGATMLKAAAQTIMWINYMLIQQNSGIIAWMDWKQQLEMEEVLIAAQNSI